MEFNNITVKLSDMSDSLSKPHIEIKTNRLAKYERLYSDGMLMIPFKGSLPPFYKRWWQNLTTEHKWRKRKINDIL